jgi:heme O synthase-like polyprenyltransferase
MCRIIWTAAAGEFAGALPIAIGFVVVEDVIELAADCGGAFGADLLELLFGDLELFAGVADVDFIA